MDNYFKGCPPRMNDGRFLQDFRQANTREQYIKTINGIVRDDDYRMFLQQNGEQIMDKEWGVLRKTQSCQTNCCIHTYPTRTSPGSNYEELKLYNAVRSNRIKAGNANYPSCNFIPDYRMSHTQTAKY
jgi:hypothetical protein